MSHSDIIVCIVALAAIYTLFCLQISIYAQRKIWNNGICAKSGKPWVLYKGFVNNDEGVLYTDGDKNFFEFDYNCVTNAQPSFWNRKIF